MSTLLIDLDPCVYRCGFASEKHSYHLVFRTNAAGMDEYVFHPTKDGGAGDQMKAWVAAMAGVEGFELLDKTMIVTPEPVAFALEATKFQIESIIKEVGAKDVKAYLSGSGNYRYGVAKQRPYKGNRDAAIRPVHYEAIRAYLQEYWGAIVIDKIEADDEISIRARGIHGVVIATIDKDLDQIPGMHYNYMKKVKYDIDETEAELFFYQQALSGDSTDNIPGCYKVGNVKAQKIVNDAFSKVGEFGDVWSAVVDTYALSKEREGCPYADGDSGAVALETARLVKLQEYEGQLWNPPDVADELVTEALYV